MNRRLFHTLRRMAGNQAVRELVLAAHGRKVARLCLEETQVPALVDVLEQAGLWVALHDRKQVIAADSGKGGWVSGYGLEVPVESSLPGYFHLYAGRDPARVLAAQKTEHGQQHAKFGNLLGYPECCTKFYEENLPLAEERQGDFFLPLLEASLPPQTEGPAIFPAWNNVAPQYFGYGLLSFYPCSFFCERAAAVAKASFQLLTRYDEKFAADFLRYARTPVLYTEYEGLYLFHEAELEDDTMRYNPEKVEMSLDGVLASALKTSNRLQVISAHCVILKNGRRQTIRLSSPYLGMAFFV